MSDKLNEWTNEWWFFAQAVTSTNKVEAEDRWGLLHLLDLGQKVF